MTKSDWLSVANTTTQFLTTVLAPLWGLWVAKKKLSSQPNPNPATMPVASRENWIKGLLTKPVVVPTIVALLGMGLLLKDLHDKTPVTRHAVMQIAFDVAIMASGLTAYSILGMASVLQEMRERKDETSGAPPDPKPRKRKSAVSPEKAN
ncbi:MAG TPA: hypothetical protein VIJ79_03910 [Acidobacteriaceae bacterium]